VLAGQVEDAQTSGKHMPRSLYTGPTFTISRFCNAHVYQSRAPILCDYVRDAINAVHTQLVEGVVGRVGIVIYASADEEGDERVEIMEKHMLGVEVRLPVMESRVLDERPDVEGRDPLSPISPVSTSVEGSSAPCLSSHVHAKCGPLDEDMSVDLFEHFRAALVQLVARCPTLTPLPTPCSWHILMEPKVDKTGNPLVQDSDLWILRQPAERMNDGEESSGQDVSITKDIRLIPIHSALGQHLDFEAYIQLHHTRDDRTADGSLGYDAQRG
jgi:mitotic spindle assembly checkpoint protein MAD2B